MKKKLCIVTASEMTVRAFLLDHLFAMQDKFDLFLITNAVSTDILAEYGIRGHVIPLRIERKIALWRDTLALFRLVQIFLHYRFDLVHSVTPKAGLLSMVAGCLARIPVRVHTFTGQVWATRNGVGRWLLKSMDRLLSVCATHLLVDSFSQQEFLVEEGVVFPSKARVLAHGSISGVDVARFRPDSVSRLRIRNELGISDASTVFLFVGRLNRDKGVLDLAVAFARLCGVNQRLHLMLVGPDEEGVRSAIIALCAECEKNIHFFGHTDFPEQYMAASDVLCLPSYREGFGSVVIEAAAVGLPAIGSRIYGITDAIEAGVSGLLHDAGDTGQLVEKMRQLAMDAAMRKKMGRDAQDRARRIYSKEVVVSAQLDFYRQLTEGGAC